MDDEWTNSGDGHVDVPPPETRGTSAVNRSAALSTPTSGTR